MRTILVNEDGSLVETIENEIIVRPTEPKKDGLGFADNNRHFIVKNCAIDLSTCDLDILDEAIGVTYGSSAYFENCYIRGAGKAILCGCGDHDKLDIMENERHKRVEFFECVITDFCRRGPEVQDQMRGYLNRCLIQNWGCPDRWDTRAFGAWAHDSGSRIEAVDCIFIQNVQPTFWMKVQDHWNHFWQAWNDEKLKGIFSKYAYQSGFRKALVSSDGGWVSAKRCYRSSRDLIIENLHDEVTDLSEFGSLYVDLITMSEHYQRLIADKLEELKEE